MREEFDLFRRYSKILGVKLIEKRTGYDEFTLYIIGKPYDRMDAVLLVHELKPVDLNIKIVERRFNRFI